MTSEQQAMINAILIDPSTQTLTPVTLPAQHPEQDDVADDLVGINDRRGELPTDEVFDLDINTPNGPVLQSIIGGPDGMLFADPHNGFVYLDDVPLFGKLIVMSPGGKSVAVTQEQLAAHLSFVSDPIETLAKLDEMAN